MVDALNRLPNQTTPVGIPYQTCDVHMFTLQHGYKVSTSTYYKEWWQKDSQHPKENISQKN